MKKSYISSEENTDAFWQSSKGKVSLAPSDDIKEPRLCSWHRRTLHFYVGGTCQQSHTATHTDRVTVIQLGKFAAA